MRALDDSVTCGLGSLGVAFRHTVPVEYPQMRSGEEAYCPTTSSGELHANLPTCHTDRGLRDNREIEGICFDGGGKLTRIVPFIPHAPQASSKLAAYGVLMEGVGGGGTSMRYGFVRTPEDGEYVASSGAAPYELADDMMD